MRGFGLPTEAVWRVDAAMPATEDDPWTIVGQGLAGTCLAWALWQRGEPFKIVDREDGGSSRIAAGLINPVTGKNFTPSWRIDEFLPEALRFFEAVERELGCSIWHPLPVLRLADSMKEWQKIQSKLSSSEIQRWDPRVIEPPKGWMGAVEIAGGGRVDTRKLLDGSRSLFIERGLYQVGELGEVSFGSPRHVWCAGAAGLLANRHGAHRSAKGEILTLRAAGWDETRVRIGAGGWLVPLGAGLFKCGSTYEWDQLDELPTREGRERVEEIASRLGGSSFEVTAHEAGIRPILRRSQPLIGPMPEGGWMFNGLGSKGSLYAPGVARQLAAWLTEGVGPDPELDVRRFSENLHPDGR